MISGRRKSQSKTVAHWKLQNYEDRKKLPEIRDFVETKWEAGTKR